MRTPIVIVALALLGCGAPDTEAEGRSAGEGADRTGPPTGELPDNAIAVRDQFYMVPLAETVGGCAAYRAYSPSERVPQAIYYRTPDGRFVTNRDEADCD